MDTDTHIPTDMYKQSDIGTVPLFCLLQISDPLFPIGGYTQSFGLETYVQKGLVKDSRTSREYLKNYLLHNYLYNDMLPVKMVWQYTKEENLEALIEVDNILSAAKSPREIRTASIKLGMRFSKIVEMVLGKHSMYMGYLNLVKSERCAGHYSVMFGMASCLFGIGKREALAALCYSAASSIINNCAKMVPISQKDGQEILFAEQMLFEGLLDKVETLGIDSIGICCAGFDLRSMQHERLYTRLYIS